jgi:hypothetical protein
MPEFIVNRQIILPDGTTAAPEQKIELSNRQAKYLLLSGKVRPMAVKAKRADKPRAEKPVTEKEQ